MELPSSNRLISLLTDYGFKVTFANEKNRLFVRKAIQLLTKSSVEVKTVKHLPTEFEGVVEDARKGFYDTVCRTDKGTFFIIEMQVGNYKNLLERLLYYTAQLYMSQVAKGKQGFAKIEPVCCICIVKDTLFDDVEEYYHKSTFRTETGKVLIDKMELIVVELGKFTQDAHEVISELDELLFTMKKAHTIDISNAAIIPPFWKKEWLQSILEELNLSTMSPQSRALFNISVARVMAINDEFEREQKKAQKAGEKIGIKLGEQLAKEKAIIASLQKGLAVELIADILDVSIAEVLRVQVKMNMPKS
jgi:predicted transposase/invertase (TIGR01784 family)